MEKERLLGKTLTELTEIVRLAGMPGFTARQICEWLYKKKVTSIDEMTNLSIKNRLLLNESYEVGADKPLSFQKSKDGTIKYLFRTSTDKPVEAVFIPDKERATLCVSSQIGCKMNCYFCMTGKQGFNGNLSANEIINQVQSIPESETLTNIVFMGMGEPLDNADELFKALEILTMPWGYAWSPKRITVSTIGLQKGLKRFLDESQCHLAISIHAAFAEKRLSIMPIEKAFPISEIIPVLHEYDFSKQRRLSFEYILFRDFNDSRRDALELCRLLKGLDCRVNLIRYHAIPGVDLRPSDMARIEEFRDIVSQHHITCTIRSSRGEDIFAACGMLSSEKTKKDTPAQ